ncbi:MAG: sulfite reductase flavoprotein subunit alpha, partial [Planctomycetota bacterium]
MQVPYIPPDAPFSGDQRAWLSGFLAGLHSRVAMQPAAGGVAVADAAPAAATKPIDILYGTQTGNSEGLANEAATLAKTRGFAPRVREFDSVSMDELAGMENMVAVISTYGEGEMPDNAQIFWDALSAPTAPRLEHLHYGVLALGDTSYEHFCQAGKLLDTRLEQLGATRLADRIDCDVDYEDQAAEWLKVTLPDAGVAVVDPAPDPAMPAADLSWSRKNPYRSTVIDNRVLSGPKSAKEIRHIAFDLGDSGIDYRAGDALGVMPVNQPDLVDAWVQRLGAAPDTVIAGKDRPLGELLSTGLEIMTPSKELVEGVASRVKDDELAHVLQGGDKQAIDAYLWGKDALDLLNLAPQTAFDPDEV